VSVSIYLFFTQALRVIVGQVVTKEICHLLVNCEVDGGHCGGLLPVEVYRANGSSVPLKVLGTFSSAP
jgi:hypothetical protein